MFISIPFTIFRQLLLCLLLSVSFAHIASAQGLSGYVLRSGDNIRIQVYGEEDLTIETQLNDAGIISYPFLGEIEIEGLTVGELQDLISEGLKSGYLVDPAVSVTVSQYREFYINGEVAQPGGFPFQPGLTVRKAISVAGGFTDRAAQRKIYILSDGNSSGSPVRVNLNTVIKPGDVITVKQRFF